MPNRPTGDRSDLDDTALDDAALATWYSYPADTTALTPWLRANFVSTLDGAVAGPDGRSGSINTAADRDAFALLRALCDVIVVGAGTARAEAYGAAWVSPRWRDLRAAGGSGSRPAAPAMAVVSQSGTLPTPMLQPDLADGAGTVVLVTSGACPRGALASARDALGSDNVVVAGDGAVDLPLALAELAGRYGGRLLCEGGARLLRQLVELELLDEMCLTTVPRLVGGVSGRLVSGADLDVSLVPMALLEADGALLGRWVMADRLDRLGGQAESRVRGAAGDLRPAGSPG
jgi:riboflavin biosynthesis pyrimidine reductase